MIDYIIQNLWLLWTIVCMLCLIIELGSGDFFFTCFAIGAACGVVSSLFPCPFWLQVLVFALCSVISLLFVRPRLTAALHKGGEDRASNADALIGRKGRLVEAIAEGGSGYVKIDGDEWKAVTADGSALAKGTMVQVISMDSIIVTVQAVEGE